MQNCLGDHEFQCWLKPHIKVQDCCITLTGNPTRLQRISRAVKCIPSVNPACFNYGVKFPIFAKVEVNGEQAHPLFDYLKKAAPFQGFDESDINAKLLIMMADKAPEWLVNNELQYEMD